MHQLARRMVFLAQLDNGVDEGAAVPVLFARLGDLSLGPRTDVAARLFGGRCHGFIPPLPMFAFVRAQIFHYQLVLGGEAAIEAHLVGACRAGDGIDANAAYAVLVEELACGFKNTVPHLAFAAFADFAGFDTLDFARHTNFSGSSYKFLDRRVTDR